MADAINAFGSVKGLTHVASTARWNERISFLPSLVMPGPQQHLSFQADFTDLVVDASQEDGLLYVFNRLRALLIRLIIGPLDDRRDCLNAYGTANKLFGDSFVFVSTDPVEKERP